MGMAKPTRTRIPRGRHGLHMGYVCRSLQRRPFCTLQGVLHRQPSRPVPRRPGKGQRSDPRPTPGRFLGSHGCRGP